MDDLDCKRVSTAPAKPLSDLGRFKRDKEFTFLEQFVVTANQMIHKTYEKYDLDSEDGQRIFKRYLGHIENLCEVRLLCDIALQGSYQVKRLPTDLQQRIQSAVPRAITLLPHGDLGFSARGLPVLVGKRRKVHVQPPSAGDRQAVSRLAFQAAAHPQECLQSHHVGFYGTAGVDQERDLPIITVV